MRLKLAPFAIALSMALLAAPLAHAQGRGGGDGGGGAGGIGKPTNGATHVDTQKAAQMKRALEKSKADRAKEAAADPAKARADAMASAATMLKSAGVGCKPSDALDAGSGVDDKKVSIHAVEAACSDTLGYFLVQTGDKVEAYDCMETTFPVVGKAGDYQCQLQGNKNYLPMIQAYLTKAKSGCVPTQAGYMIESDAWYRYEVKCSTGISQVMQVYKPRSLDSRALSADCLSLVTGKDEKFPCRLTTEAENIAPIKAMAAKANPPCDTNKVRYLISESDGSSYYEAVCADKKGIVILADPSFKMVSSMSCAKAVGIGGGCKLSDTAGAATELAQAYSDTLKAAGVNCTVGKFSALPPKLGATDAVEVECGANPGAVVVVRDGKTTVFDCARAMPEGYGCGMAPKDSVNSALTAQLNAKGHVGCVVNGSRPLASANWAYMEVSCTDGEPGFMIRYPRTSNNVDDVFTCAKATAVAGGCQLPTNKKS